MDQGNKNKISGRTKSNPITTTTIKAKNKILKCDHCNAEIKTIANLRRHIRDQHTDQHSKFQCLKCKSAFKRIDDIKTHHRKKHPNEEITFKIIETSISKYQPKIEAIEKWTPPTEARRHVKPICRIIPGKKPWISNIPLPKSTTTQTKKSTSPLPSPLITPVPSLISNVSTICLDEGYDIDRLPFNGHIYGIFQSGKQEEPETIIID